MLTETAMVTDGPQQVVSHAERERSILLGFVVALCLLIPTVVAAYLAKSLTLVVDILISLAETLASFMSWMIIRKVGRAKTHHFDYGFGKLENISGLGVSGVMLASFFVVLYEGIQRLREPVAVVESGVLLGVVLTTVAACSDTYLWIRDQRLARRQKSPLMEAEWRFFRTKSICDYCVLASLGLSLLLSGFEWSHYIDTVFSFILSGFLLVSAYMISSDSVYDLLDRTLEESLQVQINRLLVAHFHEYEFLHGVRSRRSGGHVYIEIFLEFDGGKSMGEVQGVIDSITADLESKIPSSHVVICPRTSAVV